jgi:hypothetical protein
MSPGEEAGVASLQAMGICGFWYARTAGPKTGALRTAFGARLRCASAAPGGIVFVGLRSAKLCDWSFYIFRGPNQPEGVRAPSPAGGEAAPHSMPYELFQPDPETTIDAVPRHSVVRRRHVM